MRNLKSRITTITQDTEAIILLHGLVRTSRSMNKAGKLLATYGYKIIKSLSKNNLNNFFKMPAFLKHERSNFVQLIHACCLSET